MENDIDQISVEFNDDDTVNGSFSDSNLYESVYETNHGSSESRDPRVQFNQANDHCNQELEATEYAVYDNGHRERNRIDRFRQNWKKIIVIILSLAITISVALAIKLPMDKTPLPTAMPTVEPTVTTPDISIDKPPDKPTVKPTDIPPEIPTVLSPDISTDIPQDQPTDIPPEIPTAISPDISTDLPPDQSVVPTDKSPGLSTVKPSEIAPVPEKDYTDWETWSECSQSCGQGESVRERKCLRNPCTESILEANECNIRGCE